MRYHLANPPTTQLVAWLRRASDRPGLLEVRAIGTVAEVRYADGAELDDGDAAECAALGAQSWASRSGAMRALRRSQGGEE